MEQKQNLIQQAINKLDLETEELDKVLDNLTEDEVILLQEGEPIVNILAVSPKTSEILTNHPEVQILSKGTNWQAAIINKEIYDELDKANQVPCFCYYLTINYFK